MAKPNENEKENSLAVVVVENDIAMSRSGNGALIAPENFDLAFAELAAEFEESIKQLGVVEITSPTSLVQGAEPLAESQPLNLTDAFRFEITENGQPKVIIILVVQDPATGVTYTVGQGMNQSRERFVLAFDRARQLNCNLCMTNMKFTRLNKGAKAGNFPIILRPTADTKPVMVPKL